MLLLDNALSLGRYDGYKAGVAKVGRQFGNFLAKVLADRMWTKAEIERRTGVPRLTIDRHMAASDVPDVGMRGRYAMGLGFEDVDAFDAAWRAEPIEPNSYLKEFEERAKRRSAKRAGKTMADADDPPFAQINTFYRLFRPMLQGKSEEDVRGIFLKFREMLMDPINSPLFGYRPPTEGSSAAEPQREEDDDRLPVIGEGMSDREVEQAAAAARARRKQREQPRPRAGGAKGSAKR